MLTGPNVNPMHNKLFLYITICIFSVWVVIMSIVPAAPRALLDANRPTLVPKNPLCVHTRLIDEVEEWKIQKSLELAQEMGVTAIVEFFPWAYIEPSPGQYDWQQADKIMMHANHLNIRVIARLGLVPAWALGAEEDRQTSNYLIPEYDADFANFATRFAERYSDQIQQIIIWNEPNLSFEWGFQAVDSGRYVDLLRTVYPAIKAVQPQMQVLAGALAPTLETAGSASALNELDYLNGMYEAGAMSYFDALAVHTYGFASPPGEAPSEDVLNFRRVELLRTIMEENGDTEKNIYITETGWNDHPRAISSVTPAQRADYTVEAYRYADTNWPWLEDMCIWVFRYPVTTYSVRDNFALLNAAFDPKPIYFALQAYAFDEEQDEDLWYPAPISN